MVGMCKVGDCVAQTRLQIFKLGLRQQQGHFLSAFPCTSGLEGWLHQSRWYSSGQSSRLPKQGLWGGCLDVRIIEDLLDRFKEGQSVLFLPTQDLPTGQGSTTWPPLSPAGSRLALICHFLGLNEYKLCISSRIGDYYSGRGKPVNQQVIAFEKIDCCTLSFQEGVTPHH